MQTFMSDDGRILIHVSSDFSGEAEIMVGDAPPFAFDPSILVAVGEHYLDLALAKALAAAEDILPTLEGDDRQGTVEDLVENIKQLAAMRASAKPEAVLVVRCTGCGAGYDGPLMTGFICAECSSVWDPATGKWKHPSGITPLKKAQLLAERAPKVPAEIAEHLENKTLMCPPDAESVTGHYDPAGPGGGEAPAGVPICAGCGRPRADHKPRKEGA